MFDVTVVGAGPAGAVTALVLARRGLRVAMLERGAAAGPRIGETLPGIACELLRTLGLGDELGRQGHRPAYELRSHWGAAEPRVLNTMFDRYGPGLHLDRAAFDAWLVDAAVRAGAFLEANAHPTSVERDARGGFLLEYRRSGTVATIETRALVDATGQSAWVARRLGAERVELHRMLGTARWFTADGVEPVTLIEATPDGWWYSAPLPGDRLVAVWVTTRESEAAGTDRTEAGWMRNLASAPVTRERICDARAVEGPVSRGTGPALTSWPALENFVAVGDAACSFDPISGLGLLFALRSAVDAAAVLTGPGDPDRFVAYRDGAHEVLRQHVRERQRAYAMEARFGDSSFWKAAQRDLTSELAMR